MTRIIPREEWGASYGDGSGSRPLPATEAWLHHSVTIAPDLDSPYDDDYRSIQTIDDIGKERFGWTYGFPYTFGITPVGLIFEGHDVRKMGAHTGGHNYQAIGIVFVGNYDNDEPTEAQLDACAWLLRECVRKGWLKSARLIGGHRDLKATACPGHYAYAQIAEINRRATLPEEDDMPTPSEYAQAVWDHQINDVTKPKVDGKYRTMAARSFFSWGRRDTRALYLALAELLNDEARLTRVVNDAVDRVPGADPEAIKAAFLAALRELFAERVNEEPA